MPSYKNKTRRTLPSGGLNDGNEEEGNGILGGNRGR